MLVEWGLWRRIKQELFRTIKTNGGYCGYFLYIAFLFLFWGMRWTSSLYIFLYFRNKNERLVLECMKLAPKNIQIEWNLFVDGWRGTSVVVQRREGYLEERRLWSAGHLVWSGPFFSFCWDKLNFRVEHSQSVIHVFPNQASTFKETSRCGKSRIGMVFNRCRYPSLL